MAPPPTHPEKRRWTVADYMELDDDQRYEVLEGELVMVPSPNIFHQRSITRLGTLIDSYVVAEELGECFHAPFDVALAQDTVVQPDFTFVRADRVEELFDGHCITGPPDMVVEVLSPATAERDRHRKRKIYGKAGVDWLLLVEPKARVVEVQRLNEDGKYVVDETASEDDVLTFGLFPQLELPLEQIWFHPPGDDTDQ